MCEYENAKMAGPGIMGLRDHGDQKSTDTVGVMGTYTPMRPPTLHEEAEKRVAYHREEADKQIAAAVFFRDNPAFDEFIRLIRKGVIQIALLVIVALSVSAQAVNGGSGAGAKPIGTGLTSPDKPKAPVISDVQKAAFQKARADYDEAQMQAKAAEETARESLKTAQDTMNAKIKDLQDACGAQWVAQLDRDKNPVCVEKPKEAAKK